MFNVSQHTAIPISGNVLYFKLVVKKKKKNSGSPNYLTQPTFLTHYYFPVEKNPVIKMDGHYINR